MCLIGLKISPSQQVEFILANRDEFYNRPTLAAHFWEEAPHLLAGKDLKKGGTWLGITLDGRFAALANLRSQEKNPKPSSAPSRGELVSKFLVPTSISQNREEALGAYIGEVEKSKKTFQPFHMIIGYLYGPLYYLSSFDPPKRLKAGVFVISNTSLKEPLPKVRVLSQWLEDHPHPTMEEGFKILSSQKPIPCNSLSPSSSPLEEFLSPIFILSSSYGTRSSTIIQHQGNHSFSFQERNFDSQGKLSSCQAFELTLAGPKKDHF